MASGIGDALVIKDGGLCFVTNRDGAVPASGAHALGLFCEDCRFLSGYELTIDGQPLESLVSDDQDGFRAVVQLTNRTMDGGGEQVHRQRLGVRWRHVVDGARRALRDELTIVNYDVAAHAISLELRFAADFRDIFVIRGIVDHSPGHLRPATWDGDELVLAYDGADDRRRELRVRFSEPPSARGDHDVRFALHLAPHAQHRLGVSLRVVESEEGAARVDPSPDDLHAAERASERSVADWMRGFASVSCDDPRIERVIERSLRDLRALESTIDQDRFFAGGVPWYATLFGRDSVICAIQTLAFRREIASETLRLLARLQGTKDDPSRDEAPGKIMHELRRGELARMGAIPYTPYYGSIDVTPLFLVLIARHARWSGDLALFDELRDAIEAALGWIDRTCARASDGFLAYTTGQGLHLVNQGWKDSDDAIVDAHGRRARSPIALVEVQGYVFAARRAIASLFERAGDHARADALRLEADALRRRFERAYWMEAKRFYALARQHGGALADAIASNPGQALWTGIVEPARAAAVVDRLMSDDLYSGWGIRTLAASEVAYDPVGYHLGTVWPHDNSLVAAGMRRYGFDAPAVRICDDLVDAAIHVEDQRLPETFAGYARADYGIPVQYPVACHPQAWAAGALPYLLHVLLGLRPDGFARRLEIVRPRLPGGARWLVLRGVRVADAVVDLRFDRGAVDDVAVRIERLDGRLDVAVRPAAAAR